ncbi:MAG TPA: ABC transporter ATP-binding protein [Usitatibacter sp.]|nr:ABC transporter ATP-binding protein [Usitatibacter sp.]
MAAPAISVHGVSKRFQVFESQRTRLLQALWPRERAGVKEVWALRGVDFEIARGESVAVIGRNGGGKSTLLQILTGVLAPTTGEARVDGRVSALLELGSGFNPEYTGRDNVVMNGLLLGLTRERIAQRFDDILAFADIGEAIERPVKTYSSGMVMRLAFAVQAFTEPDILIVDEALSVGDFFFQQKCFAHIRALRDRGVTLIFVSHDMGTVRDLCARAIYLKAGRVARDGPSHEAIREYLAETAGGIAAGAGAVGEAAVAAPGTVERIVEDALWRAPGTVGEGRIIAVALYDREGRPATAVRMGDVLTVRVAYRPAPGAPTHVAIAMWNKLNQVVTSFGSSTMGISPPAHRAGEAAVFEADITLQLEAGSYSVMVSLSRLTAPNRGENLDATPSLGPLAVRWDYEQENAPFLGMVGLPARGAFTVCDVARGVHGQGY